MKLVLIGFLLLAQTQAFGWGDLGHQTVGKIAQMHLSPKGRSFVFEMIGFEPLATAAIFADDVRNEFPFQQKFSAYHFIEVPMGKKYRDLLIGELPEQSAAVVLEKGPQKLLDPNFSYQQKAILFKYLVHIVGDVHQPLHVGNGVDFGANICDVFYLDSQGDKKKSGLHGYWDYVVVEDLYRDFKLAKKGEHVPSHDRFAKAIVDKEQTALPKGSAEFEKAQNAPFTEWLDESQNLHAVAYPDALPPHQRKYCVEWKKRKGEIPEQYLPMLEAKFAENGKAMVSQRIYLAGIRLAGLINSLAEKNQSPNWTEQIFTNELGPILLKK